MATLVGKGAEPLRRYVNAIPFASYDDAVRLWTDASVFLQEWAQRNGAVVAEAENGKQKRRGPKRKWNQDKGHEARRMYDEARLSEPAHNYRDFWGTAEGKEICQDAGCKRFEDVARLFNTFRSLSK